MPKILLAAANPLQAIPVLKKSTATASFPLSHPPVRDLKNLTLDQQKDLRKAKWSRLTTPKWRWELVPKHIGDEELAEKLLSGEFIDVDYFRNKWAHSAIHFYNKTKKYYLYP